MTKPTTEPNVPRAELDSDGSLFFTHRCNGREWQDRLPLNQRIGWRIEQAQPLTVLPSIHCQVCDIHGWIRHGSWVEAG